jgi:NitT/TauT family transport system ATP-binding protein
MVAGLRAQSEGTVLCLGRPIPAPDPDRVGVVFQDASLFPWLTALDNIDFPLSLRGTAREERRRRTQAMLTLVGLDGFGTRYPHELSGGMRQRVSIARGLAQDPPVLLMDEPFAALDEITRTDMRHLLAALCEPLETTVLFVTHSIPESVFLSDRVVVLSSRPGRIVGIEAIHLPRPRHPELEDTQDFFAVETRLRALLHEGAWW